MTIYELRDMLEHSSIYDLPLRCATYSRVSTEKETQAASLINMTDDFRDFVEGQPSWTLVKAFVDDGKSGLTTKKRTDFLNLLAAGAAGEYDLLVTGEISRFGRNTMEGLENIQYLKKRGIPVIFLYDDLNTYDANCDIQIQQKLVDAESESHKISRRVKRGHQKSIRKGRVLGNGCWGYRKVNCKLIVDEETAPMVQLIFELYATGKYSMSEVEQIIYDKGYRNTNGNRLSHTTMSNIIRNPKYMGYFAGGKVNVVDIYSKKQKFLPQDQWVMFRDETGEVVPALVDEELWRRANEVLEQRSIDVKGRRNCSNHRNTYTGKLFCTVDGAPYYCKDVHYKGTDVSKWVCSHRLKNGAESCPSVAIYESELNPVVLDVFRQFARDADSILEQYLDMYRQSLDDSDRVKEEQRRLQRELTILEHKQEELLTMKIEGILTLDEFKRMMDKTRDQMADVKKELDATEHREKVVSELEESVDRLKKALKYGMQTLEDGMVTREFVDSYIRRIDVTPVGGDVLELEVRLLTDDTVQREICGGSGRTVHTFKKMIEAYENGLK